MLEWPSWHRWARRVEVSPRASVPKEKTDTEFGR